MTTYTLPITCRNLTIISVWVSHIVTITFMLLVLFVQYDNVFHVMMFGSSLGTTISYWLFGAMFGYGLPSKLYKRIPRIKCKCDEQ